VDAELIHTERKRGSNDNWEPCVIDGNEYICRTGYEQSEVYILSVGEEAQIEQQQVSITDNLIETIESLHSENTLLCDEVLALRGECERLRKILKDIANLKIEDI